MQYWNCQPHWVVQSRQQGIEAQELAGEWVVTVQDNGVGISDEESPKVFAPFTRGAVSGNEPGHGLGLTICRRIDDRHGGRIWVEPAAGGGSRFRFSLPAR